MWEAELVGFSGMGAQGGAEVKHEDMKHEEGESGACSGSGVQFGGVVVVEVEDLAAGFADSSVGLVFFYDALEGGEDVVDVFSGEAVEVEVGGVELGAEAVAFVVFALVDFFGEAAGEGEGDHVVGGARELEDAVADLGFEGAGFGPGAFFGVGVGGKRRPHYNSKLSAGDEIDSASDGTLPVVLRN
jgi:hypothetical protein